MDIYDIYLIYPKTGGGRSFLKMKLFAGRGKVRFECILSNNGFPHPKTSRSVGVIFSKFLQSALFSKIHSYVAHVFQKRISSLKNDCFLTLVYQNAYIEYIHDLRN